VLLPSSAAGQCGQTPTCEAVIPITEFSLSFDTLTPVAGDETDIEMSMLVSAPISEGQAINVLLPGFTASDVTDFTFQMAETTADSVFLLNDLPSVSTYTSLGCIQGILRDSGGGIKRCLACLYVIYNPMEQPYELYMSHGIPLKHKLVTNAKRHTLLNLYTTGNNVFMYGDVVSIWLTFRMCILFWLYFLIFHAGILAVFAF
jgi:hypothetical protein